MNGAVSGVLYSSVHQLVARNDTNSTLPSTGAAQKHPPSYKLVGLTLAIASGCFIGVSFVLKKLGLLKANLKYNEEAGEGYGYLKNAWWWGGMTLMILGEICNFAAYLFADAILVTPLGALSVVITAILSGIFLKERLSFVGKIGCFNCIIGAIVIAANAPTQSAVDDIQEMKRLVLSPGFLVYAGVIIIGCAVVAIWVAPKYGKKSMMVYLTVCSLIGGLSVICIQGIGAAITAQARGEAQFNQWFLYVVIVFVIVTLVTEIIYLNKALNLYNAALVTPTYYVYFTSATIVSGAILFQGFKGTAIQIITVVLGFLQICSGVVLLQLSKSAKDVPDTAVFSGDLDQVRTVAEQVEPEYEPRADTMRGTASLLRAISTRRQKRETQEIHRIREEHMEPIGENEAVEWDGLRRRRTLSTPGSSPNIQRRKTIHPPLGMSHFPTDDDEDGPDGMHPGFWTHFKRKPVSSGSDIEPNNASLPMDNLKSEGGLQDEYGRGVSPHPSSNRGSHNFGLPSALRHVQSSNGSDYFGEDTTYHGADGSHPISPNDGHVHFAPGSISAPQLAQGRARGDSLGSPQGSPPTAARSAIGLPRSPRDGARRQFSFQNVFHRSRSPHNASAPEQSTRAPMSRSGLSFTRRSPSSATSRADGTGGTEEERLGLVRGDTHNGGERVPGYDSRRGSQASTENGANSPPRYDSAGGTVVRRPPNQRRDSDEDDAPQGADAKELESGAGAHGRSFI